jgi:hypothetical protein
MVDPGGPAVGAAGRGCTRQPAIARARRPEPVSAGLAVGGPLGETGRAAASGQAVSQPGLSVDVRPQHGLDWIVVLLGGDGLRQRCAVGPSDSVPGDVDQKVRHLARREDVLLAGGTVWQPFGVVVDARKSELDRGLADKGERRRLGRRGTWPTWSAQGASEQLEGGEGVADGEVDAAAGHHGDGTAEAASAAR